MVFLYKVRPLSREFVALEALHAEVKRHDDKKVKKERVVNVLQQYRTDINETTANLVKVDEKLAGEYLDTAMTVRYQQRLADLAGELLSASSVLAFKANRNDFSIVPIGVTPLLRKQYSTFPGSVPKYTDVKKYLSDVKLFCEKLKVITRYTDLQFFKTPEDASAMLSKTRDLFDTFSSPMGNIKLKQHDDDSEYEILWDDVKGEMISGFTKAGWTYDRLIECQTLFSGIMVDLSKTIYVFAQAINRFNMNANIARTFGYFSIYSERVTESLIRLPSMFAAAFTVPWVSFKKEFTQ